MFFRVFSHKWCCVFGLQTQTVHAKTRFCLKHQSREAEDLFSLDLLSSPHLISSLSVKIYLFQSHFSLSNLDLIFFKPETGSSLALTILRCFRDWGINTENACFHLSLPVKTLPKSRTPANRPHGQNRNGSIF